MCLLTHAAACRHNGRLMRASPARSPWVTSSVPELRWEAANRGEQAGGSTRERRGKPACCFLDGQSSWTLRCQPNEQALRDMVPCAQQLERHLLICVRTMTRHQRKGSDHMKCLDTICANRNWEVFCELLKGFQLGCLSCLCLLVWIQLKSVSVFPNRKLKRDV